MSTSSELRVSFIVLSLVLAIETNGSAKVIVSTFNGNTVKVVEAVISVPSFVFAVITVLPIFFPVTMPLASTIATSGFSELHSSSLVPAFSGNIVYSNFVGFALFTDTSLANKTELVGYKG
nr:hypothetical protein [uncultured Prevotella sp.]